MAVQSYRDADGLHRGADRPERAGECGDATGLGVKGALALAFSHFAPWLQSEVLELSTRGCSCLYSQLPGRGLL